MKSPVYLHSLEPFVEFTYLGVVFKTPTPIMHKTVNKALQNMKRDVINLKTNRLERLPYFAKVKL